MRIINPKFLRRWVAHLKTGGLYEKSGLKEYLRKASREGYPLSHQDIFGRLRESLSEASIKRLLESARRRGGALAEEAFLELDQRPKQRLILRLKPDAAGKHLEVRSQNSEFRMLTPDSRILTSCNCPICQSESITTDVINLPSGKYTAIGCCAHDADSICKHPDVEFYEEDSKVQLVGELVSWGYERVGVQAAYDVQVRGQGVKVAVLDTGVDYTHEEFKYIYKGGYDFWNNDNNPIDDHWHGTHVAGILCAGANAVGYRGIAPRAELYAVKVLNENGFGYLSTVAAGIDWCRQNGIEVINLSLGGSTPSQVLKEACDTAKEDGIIIVAAAGNAFFYDTVVSLPTYTRTMIIKDTVLYPAKFDSVLAVAATMKAGHYEEETGLAINPNDREKDMLAYFSSSGPAVAVAAPGYKIDGPVPKWKIASGYAMANGTSMASPHVVGLVALLKQNFPRTSLKEIKKYLQEAALLGDDNYTIQRWWTELRNFYTSWNPTNPIRKEYQGSIFGAGVAQVPEVLLTKAPEVLDQNMLFKPYVLHWPNPRNGQTNVPVGNPIKFFLRSNTYGIDLRRVKVKITDSAGETVYSYKDKAFSWTGDKFNYLIEVRPPRPWQYEETVQVEIEAEDFVEIPGPLYEYV